MRLKTIVDHDNLLSLSATMNNSGTGAKMPTTAYTTPKGIGLVQDVWQWSYHTQYNTNNVYGYPLGPIRLQTGSQMGYKTPKKERAAFFNTNGYSQPFSYYRWGKDLNFAKVRFSGADPCRGYWVANDLYSDVTSKVRLENCPFLPSPSQGTPDARFVALRDKVVSKLNSDVRSNSAGMGETLFEMRKTVDMILGVQGKVLLAYRHVRKFRFDKAAKVLGLDKKPKGLTSRSKHRRSGKPLSETAAGNWLEYRYGWLPLYSTVYGLMEAAYKFSVSKPPVIRVSRFQKLEEDVTYHPWGTYSGYCWPASNTMLGAGTAFRAQVTGRRTLSVSGTYYYKLTSPLVGGLGVLGLDNPVLLAWELFPLSFVADWFVNVSDVLEQLTAWNGKTFLAGHLTYHEYDNLNFQAEKVAGTPCQAWTTMSPSVVSTTSSQFQTYRELLGSAPSVSLAFNIELNTKRIADAAALFKVLLLK